MELTRVMDTLHEAAKKSDGNYALFRRNVYLIQMPQVLRIFSNALKIAFIVAVAERT